MSLTYEELFAGRVAIHRWALNRLDWLSGVLALPNGLPSRDCIRRVLIALQPAAFQKCLQAWTTATFPILYQQRAAVGQGHWLFGKNLSASPWDRNHRDSVLNPEPSAVLPAI